ncbi:MAG: hypothetical protein AAF903_15760 [Pseudomonadota bacterium]
MPEDLENDSSDNRFSWKRLVGFIRNVVRLEAEIQDLRQQNSNLERRIEELQRIVNNHEGQLKVLLTAMNSTTERAVKAEAQELAAAQILRLMQAEQSEKD